MLGTFPAANNGLSLVSLDKTFNISIPDVKKTEMDVITSTSPVKKSESHEVTSNIAPQSFSEKPVDIDTMSFNDSVNNNQTSSNNSKSENGISVDEDVSGNYLVVANGGCEISQQQFYPCSSTEVKYEEGLSQNDMVVVDEWPSRRKHRVAVSNGTIFHFHFVIGRF